MARLHVIAFTMLLIESVLSRLQNIHHLPKTAFHMPGDVNIGGIVTLSHFSSDKPCSDQLMGTVQMQFVEAMAFAVDRVNANTTILPGVSLGLTILDDCSKDTTALAQALRFLPQCPNEICKRSSGDGDSGQCSDAFDIAAVVGAMASKNSMAAANILNQFHIPQVSAVSTSDLLSDKKRYRYFMRMVSPDRIQVRTIIDFIAYFNWTYISVIASKGSYGSHGLKLIQNKAKEKGVCIAYSTELMDGMSPAEYDMIVDDLLLRKDTAKVVIMYADVAGAQGVFRAAQKANAQGIFTWIISDAFSSPDSHKGIEDVVNQSFITKMFARHVPDFDEYFTKLTPLTNNRNPWFKKFWTKYFGCSFTGGGNVTLCENHMVVSTETGYQQDTRVSLFIDAVTTIAIALDRLIYEKCPNARRQNQLLKECVTGERLLAYLLKTHFRGEVGDVHFDDNGNMFGKYSVSQILYDVENGTRMSKVAEWCPVDGLNVNIPVISWYGQSETPPKSMCSEPCDAGSVPVKGEVTCCWTCRKCRMNEIVTSDLSDCQECVPNTWPNQTTFRSCEEIPPEYLKIHNPITLILLSLTCLGMCSCFLVLVIFIKNKTMKIIKASSLEVNFVIGIGVFFAYLTVLAFLWPSSTGSCLLSYLGFSVSFTLLYAPLLIKTIRIYRIFQSAQYGNKRPNFIANNWQLLFSVSLIFVQVAITVIMILSDRPKPVLAMPVPTKALVELHCSFPRFTLLTPLAYNVVLIFICVIYGFKTRKLPDNFNESKYIFVCACATLFLWCAFLPTYFATFYSIHKSILLSVSLIMNGTVFIFCLFTPRIYAVYYMDEKKIKFTTVSMRMPRHQGELKNLNNMHAQGKDHFDSEIENEHEVT